MDLDTGHIRNMQSACSSRLRADYGSWDGSEGEGGEDRGLRDSLTPIAEEFPSADSSPGVLTVPAPNFGSLIVNI